MKSPLLTHTEDYIKFLKLYLVRNSHHKPSDHEDEVASHTSSMLHSSKNGYPSQPREVWRSVADVPHMEINRRTLHLRPPYSTTENKTLTTVVLDLKTDKQHVQTIREAILSANISDRAHGIFIPTTFIKESPQAVYNTALCHIHFLQTLLLIPVSGLHRSTFSVDISNPEEPHTTFFRYSLSS